jgi:methylated-DNA-[protein]-cysteine S-methyltransferase
VLDGCTRFARDVLTACRAVSFGQTASYLELAAEIGRPDTVRAVGGALAKNPLSLIVPCHRIIRSDGKIGGFSASGGIAIKKRLLQLEQ